MSSTDMAEARDTPATNVDDDDDKRGSSVAAPVEKGGATIPITVILLALLVASVAAFLMTSPPDGKPRMEGAGGEGGTGAARTGSEPVEHAVGHGVPGFNSRLDAFRTWAKLAWMKLQRPHSDEPRYDSGGIAGSAAEAAKKSVEMGKETAEQAAAAAAGAAGTAKDKVMGAAASSSDAEL